MSDSSASTEPGEEILMWFASGSRSRSWFGIPILASALALFLVGPAAHATPITSAANIPFSGISPGGVDMATGELIVTFRTDLELRGPFPVGFGRYYAS